MNSLLIKMYPFSATISMAPPPATLPELFKHEPEIKKQNKNKTKNKYIYILFLIDRDFYYHNITYNNFTTKFKVTKNTI